MRRTRFLPSLAVALTATLALAACGGGGSSTSATTAGGAATYDSSHRGGTMTILAQAAGGTLDPQINYTNQYWQLYQGVYDGLVSFKKVGGEDSFTVVPDLAESTPTPTDGGKTWTFTLRKGIEFSDGSPVTVDDVVASFQRIFKVSSPTAGSFYNGIVGADACLATPATCTLDGGLSADATANTVTFHLTAADAEFLYKLAVPHASVLPKSAPSSDAGSTPIPGTGPYEFASYDPNSALVMKRNTHFQVWSTQAQPDGYADEIDEKFGETVESAVTDVQNGNADWVFDPVPADRLTELGTSYASQVHVSTLTAFWYAPVNVNIAPFNNLQARQAVNWAVDRNALVKLFGGTNLASPVCTILPPDFPGHVDDCQYTKPAGSTWAGPDLDKAKQLVTESGTAGQSVTVIVADDAVSKSIGDYLASVLTQIGYDATSKPISGNIQFTYIQNTNNNVQISVSQWYQDYPAASDFLNILLGCSSYTPGSDSSINISGFCDKDLQAKMDAAEQLGNTDPTSANAQWAQIDKEMMTAAPVVPLFTPKQADFVSKRLGNYQFSSQFHMLVSQAWVK